MQRQSIDCSYSKDPKGGFRCVACGDKRAFEVHRNCPVMMRLLKYEPSKKPENPLPAPTTPTKSEGPGTELKKWLASQGLPACKRCAALAADMDRGGLEWCEENLGYIVNRILENVAALKVIEAETWSGRAKLAALHATPDTLRAALIRDAVTRHGIEAYRKILKEKSGG